MNWLRKAWNYQPTARVLTIVFTLGLGAELGGITLTNHHHPIGYAVSIPSALAIAYSLGKALFGRPRL